MDAPEVNVRDCRERKTTVKVGTSSGVYGMAVIGAAVYYIQHSSGFWDGAFGIVKACLWPAILAYKALEFLSK
jgi:hypothetical protein